MFLLYYIAVVYPLYVFGSVKSQNLFIFRPEYISGLILDMDILLYIQLDCFLSCIPEGNKHRAHNL